MSSELSDRSSKRKSSILSSHFDPDDLTENDIEQIWKNLVRTTNYSPTKSTPQVKMGSSLETTPTTDYGSNLIPLHAETEEEAIEQDKQLAKMNAVLRAKKLHPKSYLPQVILCENVSHERLLSMRLEEIRQSHQAAEKRAKRREESFVKSLEKKQQEWIKRDNRIVSKLEAENLSEFNFTFGRLYTKPDYPYQTVVEALYSIQAPDRTLDYARRRPKLLPQVTNRPIYDDEDQDKTFITKLPKYRDVATNPLPPITGQLPDPWKSRRNDRLRTKEDRNYSTCQTGARRFRKTRPKPKDWTKDKRFHKLTSLLGDRYSPTGVDKPTKPAKTHETVLYQT